MIEEKNKIDILKNSSWNKMKKIGNPYELIYTTYNKKKNNSISSYIPISRSYFKLWEIFYNFDLFKYFDKDKNFVFSHLAEGPGGFMEATYNYRNKHKKYNNDIYYGITLKPINNFIPDWNKMKDMFKNQNIKIHYGNLYDSNDVKKYIKLFSEKKSNFVTADGGFDVSDNFNNQEINSCQIIYSECIVALHILEFNGCFVCKVFDLFSITMTQILYILYLSFEKIYIYKPDTSRPANSEKYLICLYYKNNLDNETKNNLLHIIEKIQLQQSSTDSSFLLTNIKINNQFIQCLNEYNEKYTELQLFHLNNIIKLTDTKMNKEEYNKIVKKQVQNAIEWCNKYHIEKKT